ncbi:MAG: helix-turn-helix domain-containing protein [Muribaculum sp.]|nr:helix-turn-helix domain-containing protein [Muribaculum sp.]
MRQKKMAISNQETSRRNQNRYSDKDFLTPTETALFLGIGRTFIYDSINLGKIKVTRFGRKTLISKADIATMFGYLSPREAASVTTEKNDKTITEFYTRAEIREKFGVKDSWIYNVVAENNVP